MFTITLNMAQQYPIIDDLGTLIAVMIFDATINTIEKATGFVTMSENTAISARAIPIGASDFNTDKIGSDRCLNARELVNRNSANNMHGTNIWRRSTGLIITPLVKT